MKSLKASSFNLLWEYKDDVPLKLKEKTNSFEQDISKNYIKIFQTLEHTSFENIVKIKWGWI